MSSSRRRTSMPSVRSSLRSSSSSSAKSPSLFALQPLDKEVLTSPSDTAVEVAGIQKSTPVTCSSCDSGGDSSQCGVDHTVTKRDNRSMMSVTKKMKTWTQHKDASQSPSLQSSSSSKTENVAKKIPVAQRSLHQNNESNNNDAEDAAIKDELQHIEKHGENHEYEESLSYVAQQTSTNDSDENCTKNGTKTEKTDISETQKTENNSQNIKNNAINPKQIHPIESTSSSTTASSSTSTQQLATTKVTPPPPISPSMPSSLPPGWKAVIDIQNTGFAYYVNTLTQQSQWEIPSSPATAVATINSCSMSIPPPIRTSMQRPLPASITTASSFTSGCSRSRQSGSCCRSIKSNFLEQAQLLDALFEPTEPITETTPHPAHASAAAEEETATRARATRRPSNHSIEFQLKNLSLSRSNSFASADEDYSFDSSSSTSSSSSDCNPCVARKQQQSFTLFDGQEEIEEKGLVKGETVKVKSSKNEKICDFPSMEPKKHNMLLNEDTQKQQQQEKEIPQTENEQHSFITNNGIEVQHHDGGDAVSLISHIDYLAIGFIESSPDPMFQIDEEGTIHMVNQAATLQFQYNREEFLGANISIIVGTCHNPDKHTDYIQRYIRTGEKRVMGLKRELMARRRDGSEFPIELGLSEVISKGDDSVTSRRFCGFIRDVTSQYKNQLELKRRERISNGLIESSLDPMFNITSRGIIRMVNQKAIDQFGWTRDKFIGQNISMIVGKDYNPERHDDYIQRYLLTGKKRVMGKKRELKARRKDGSEFPIELSLTEVTIDGDDDDALKSSGSYGFWPNGEKKEVKEEKLFCGFVRDLTQQKEYIEDLARKERYTSGIIEASFDSMIVFDDRGIIRRCNGVSCHQFGYSESEFVSGNMNVKKILEEEYRDEYVKEIERYMETGGNNSGSEYIGKQREAVALRKNGTSFPVWLGIMEVESDQSSSSTASFVGGYKGTSTNSSSDKPFRKLFVAFVHDLTDQKKLMQVEIEKTAAEVLLLNILPAEIASRLKNNPSNNIADHHKMATVLFADIVGFTALSSKLEPFEVVKMLNELFSLFDDLVDKYDINKVKTIGDCYMVTSVPVVEHEADECVRVCHFAFDMLEMVQLYNATHPDSADIQIRIGINSGPVVAGVVGTKRFFYDLWGDAVNIASRMESTGVAGRIQVTKDVVDLLGSSFKYEKRGKIHVKGKGQMDTFFLRGRGKRRSSFFETSAPKYISNEATGKSCKNLSWSLMESLKAFEKVLTESGMDSTELGLDFEGIDEDDEDEDHEDEREAAVDDLVEEFLTNWPRDVEEGLEKKIERKC